MTRALTAVALTLTLTFSLLAAPAVARHRTVTVKPGDTLAEIADRTGSVGGWPRLAYRNRRLIDDPNVIRVGWRLTLPHKATPTWRVAPRPAPAASRSSGGGGFPWPWDELAQCESSGNWSINTGNGYYGGLQHSLSTWRAFGGSGYPHHASPATQVAVATRVQAVQGWGAWPGCAAKLGLR